MNSTPNDVIRADYSSQALSIDSKIKKHVCLFTISVLSLLVKGK